MNRPDQGNWSRRPYNRRFMPHSDSGLKPDMTTCPSGTSTRSASPARNSGITSAAIAYDARGDLQDGAITIYVVRDGKWQPL